MIDNMVSIYPATERSEKEDSRNIIVGAALTSRKWRTAVVTQLQRNLGRAFFPLYVDRAEARPVLD